MKIICGYCSTVACFLLIANQGMAATVPAKEGNIDTMTCYAGTQHVITDGKGVVGFSFDVVGTPMRSEGDPMFRSSTRCVGSGVVIGTEVTHSGSCLTIDRDGDRFVITFSGRNQEPGPWKAISGTGKFDGMEASGTWNIAISPVNPARPDISQSCNKETGHWKMK